MAENTILEKLEGLIARFEEVSTLITDPSVIADQKRYVKLTREYKELEDLMKARKEYIAMLANIKEGREILSSEDDHDMKEMAREEIAKSEDRIPELEEEIKLMLIPADPEDDKNAVLEIRGGAGGDEAAIFAGDLLRMYLKYFETKGWQCEISSCTEGSSGGYKEVICNVLYVIPGIVQLFAIFILLEQGHVLPQLLPGGIVFGVSCFFGLYLTYTAVIAFTAIGKCHRLTSGFLWAFSALAFAITSYLG